MNMYITQYSSIKAQRKYDRCTVYRNAAKLNTFREGDHWKERKLNQEGEDKENI